MDSFNNEFIFLSHRKINHTAILLWALLISYCREILIVFVSFNVNHFISVILIVLDRNYQVYGQINILFLEFYVKLSGDFNVF